MKITGVAVALVDGGAKVTVEAFLPGVEDLEESDTQRMLDAMRELSGGQAVSRDTNREEIKGEVGAEVVQGGRRRRGSSDPTPIEQAIAEKEMPARRRRGAPAADAAPESDAETPPTAQSNASAGRRRRSNATTSEPAPTENSAPEGASVERSGRRRRAVPTSTPSNAASEDAPSRRSRSAATAPASPTKSAGAGSTEIGDEVLLKACSLTARKCGTETVKAVLQAFAVGEVGKLPKGDRQDFLDDLAAARAEADA